MLEASIHSQGEDNKGDGGEDDHCGGDIWCVVLEDHHSERRSLVAYSLLSSSHQAFCLSLRLFW